MSSYCLTPLLLQDLTLDTDLTAANGKKIKALEIFAYALQYFKEQALKVGQVAVPGVAVEGGWRTCHSGCLEGESVGFACRKQGAPS